jgi:hypothetical protein
MSERQLKFFLSELQVVRVLCQGRNGVGCAGVVELPIDRLAERYRDQKCPLCGADIPNSSPNYLEMLGNALVGLRGNRGLKLEFVLPDPPSKD